MQVVQFHPNTAYEDFVRGYRPHSEDSGAAGLKLVDGPFLRLSERAHTKPLENFTMVIEEINRGNPARALGEMLTLIEATKRSKDEAIEHAKRFAKVSGATKIDVRQVVEFSDLG